MLIERVFTKELMRVFIEACKNDSISPSINEFFNWVSQIKSRSLIFYFKLIWGHLLPIEIFRKANARNNLHYRIAAEKKVDCIFFAGKQSNYQRIAIERDVRRLALKSTLLNRYRYEICPSNFIPIYNLFLLAKVIQRKQE